MVDAADIFNNGVNSTSNKIIIAIRKLRSANFKIFVHLNQNSAKKVRWVVKKSMFFLTFDIDDLNNIWMRHLDVNVQKTAKIVCLSKKFKKPDWRVGVLCQGTG